MSIEGASGNTIRGNSVERNVSVGILIQGTQATGNLVTRNEVSFNGGYGERLGGGRARSSDSPRRCRRPWCSSGIDPDAARGNIIGSEPVGTNRKRKAKGKEDITQRNTISGNTLVDIYLFNGATNNHIRSNLVGIGRRGERTGGGAYGVFLFNSAGNLNLVEHQGEIRQSLRPPSHRPIPGVHGPCPVEAHDGRLSASRPSGSGPVPTVAAVRASVAATGKGRPPR